MHRASSSLSQPGTRGKVYTAEYCRMIQVRDILRIEFDYLG